MAFAARWIRSAPVGPYDLNAACIGLALAQHARAAPIVFWARVSAPVLGDPRDIEQNRFAFALIAPRRHAPGRRSRWCAWALAPALAAVAILVGVIESIMARLRMVQVPQLLAGAAALAALGVILRVG